MPRNRRNARLCYKNQCLPSPCICKKPSSTIIKRKFSNVPHISDIVKKFTLQLKTQNKELAKNLSVSNQEKRVLEAELSQQKDKWIQIERQLIETLSRSKRINENGIKVTKDYFQSWQLQFRNQLEQQKQFFAFQNGILEQKLKTLEATNCQVSFVFFNLTILVEHKNKCINFNERTSSKAISKLQK